MVDNNLQCLWLTLLIADLLAAVARAPHHPSPGPPCHTPSTIQGSMNYQAARAPKRTGALHPKKSTKNVTGAPSSAGLNTRSQLGVPRVNTGRSSPLVGNRVDFATKIAYFIKQNYPEMAKKLKQLPHLFQRRSICGRHTLALQCCCTLCPAAPSAPIGHVLVFVILFRGTVHLPSTTPSMHSLPVA